MRQCGGETVGHGEVKRRRDGCPSHEGKRVWAWVLYCTSQHNAYSTMGPTEQRGVPTENPGDRLPRMEYCSKRASSCAAPSKLSLFT